MTTYEEVAKQHDLPLNTTKRFIIYMRKRWVNEEKIQCQTGYASEWAERFKYMLEYSASDMEGQRILREIDGDHPSTNGRD